MRTDVYLPSYVEWLTCLEMERDVRKMQVGRTGHPVDLYVAEGAPGQQLVSGSRGATSHAAAFLPFVAAEL